MQDIMVIYVSQAVAEFDSEDLRRLARIAAERNRQAQITGALLRAGNYFMQILEGPVGAVSPLLSKIAADPRHQDVRVVFKTPISGRLFARWNMGCLDADAVYSLPEAHYARLRDHMNLMLTQLHPTVEEVQGVIRTFPDLLLRCDA